MRWRHATVGLILAAVLAAAAPAQQALKDAMQDLEKRLQGMKDDEAKKQRANKAEMENQLEGMRPFWQLVEIDQLLAENKLKEALAKAAEMIAALEKKRPERLSPREITAYREALLRRGRACTLLGEPEEASAAALQAWKVHDRLMASWRSPSQSEQQDTMRTALGVALLLLETEEQDDAARSIQRVLDAGQRLPAPHNRADHNPLLASALALRSLQAGKAGSHRAALEDGKEALAALGKPGPRATIDVNVAALQVNLAQAHLALGDADAAFAALREADAILTRNDHRGKLLRAEVCRLLAHLNLQQGRPEAALDAIGRAHKMYQDLFPEKEYPRSHPLAIQALTSLADLLNQLRCPDALAWAETAWSHCQRRYQSRAHPQTVAALLTHGRCLRDADQLYRAQQKFAQAQEQAAQLCAARPGRESDALLALCRLHLGSLLGRQGRHREAGRLFDEARAGYEKLAIDGHPYLFAAAAYQGVLALQQGDRERACTAFADALRLDREQLSHVARAAVDAELLAFSQPRQLAWQGYLCASRDKASLDEQAYRATWVSKGALTRLAQARRAAAQLARVRGNEEARQALARLVDVCARLRQAQTTAHDRTGLLDLHREMEELEAKLSPFWPEAEKLLRDGEKDAGDLAAQLPAGSAFLDFVQYHDFSERAMPAHYVAFLVLPGQKPRRIELGASAPIDEQINRWREAVKAWQPLAEAAARASQAESDRHAAQLRTLLWEPIAQLLPVDTKLLILAPDGDLARFPFAALPASDSHRILLEDYSIAYVPHGPQLLSCLLQAKEHAAYSGRFLAVGGVDYGPGASKSGRGLKRLDGSREVLALAEERSAAQPVQVLRDGDASVDALLAALVHASEAHLATHGFFDADSWEQDRKEQLRRLREWTPQLETPVGHLGLRRRFPLSYVGLALAGANEPQTKYGGILTGEPISNLSLTRTRLIIPDGCDTGLGQYTAGEGVQGLQRAFHLAGCPNVIATLWHVNDSAARLLTREFYRQLWHNKLPTLEALRQAQLALYHNPPALMSGGTYRGIGEEKPFDGREIRLPERTASGGCPVQVWGAAYVHSGIGDPLVDLDELAERVRSLQREETAAPPAPGLLPWLVFGGLPALTAGMVLLLRWWRKPSAVPVP